MREMTIAFLGVLLLATAACGGVSDSEETTAATPVATGDPARGFELYRRSCMVCHGPNGEGIPGLGKPWVGSEFIDARTDAEMLAFLLVGRPAGDPLNTTGIAMLPKGGNPSLTEADLLDLVAFMRTLNI